MNCLNEKKIEKYILGAINLNRMQVQHILNCDRCRQQYEFLKSIYSQIKDNNAIQLIDEAVGDELVLTPMVLKFATTEFEYKLAAQTESELQRYTVHHFSNEKEQIIGRILHDKITKVISLYLLADDPDKIRCQKIKILDSELEAITDDNGFAKFGKQDDFICTGIKIESPLAIFDLEPLISEQKQIDEKYLFKLKNKNHDEIFIEVNQNQTNKIYRISLRHVKGADDRKELKVFVLTDTWRLISSKAEKGVSVLETGTDEKILKIHIF